jgi:hypothetical protein
MKDDNASKDSKKSIDELDRLYHKLRGHINALGLCVRVMQKGSAPREMAEYAHQIEETSAQIKKLVAKLGRQEKAP